MVDEKINYIQNANKHLSSAIKFAISKRFTADIALNSVISAFENYLMALMDYKGHVPTSHSLGGLLNETAALYSFQAGLLGDLKKHSKQSTACSLQNGSPITYADIEQMIETGKNLREFCEEVM